MKILSFKDPNNKFLSGKAYHQNVFSKLSSHIDLKETIFTCWQDVIDRKEFDQTDYVLMDMTLFGDEQFFVRWLKSSNYFAPPFSH